MSYRKKNIVRDKIDQTIQEYFGGVTSYKKITKPNNLVIYEFVKTGEKKAQVNFYFNMDGTTTINYATGQNQNFSMEIADAVLQHCEVKKFNGNKFYLSAIRDEDFNIVIEYVSDIANEITKKDLSNGLQFKLKGKQGDVLSVTHYRNDALLVQGRPGVLFHEIIEILSELLPVEEVISSQLEYYETNISAGEILTDLNNRMPEASKKMHDKVKSVIAPALALKKLKIELTDFSAFAFPSSRGLEGVMKQLFSDHNVVIANSTGFGPYFIKNGNTFEFSTLAKVEVAEVKYERVLCRLYNFYNEKRHSLVHMDGTVASSKILTRAEAERIVDATLDLIENSYIEITSS